VTVCVVSLLPCVADCCMLYTVCKVERFVLTIIQTKEINVCRPNQVRLCNFVGRRDGNGQQHSRHGVQPSGPVHQEQLQQAATETARSCSYCCEYFDSRLWDLKLHCESKKLHHFIFAITLSYLFYIAVIIGVHIPQYTWNKMTSESSVSFGGCFYTA